MKTGGALLLIAVGLVALWIVVTGKLPQLEAAWNVLAHTPPGDGTTPAPVPGGLSPLDIFKGLPGAPSSTPSPFGGPLPLPVFKQGAI